MPRFGRVLVINHDAAEAARIQESLENVDVRRVTHFAAPDEAWRELVGSPRSASVKLVLLDAGDPEAAEQFVRATMSHPDLSHIRIVITGEVDTSTALRLLRQGACHVLKSFGDRTRLEDVLHRLARPRRGE